MSDFETGESYAASPDESPLVTHVSHRAMATQFVVLLPERESNKVETVVEALETLDEIESRLTVYRPNSEVSRINRDASNAPVRISPDVYRVLQKSLTWSERTGGAFDISAGPLIEAWGFTQRSGRKPTDSEVQDARDQVGHKNIELIASPRSVSFKKQGMSINLGAIGKGDALDTLAQHLLSCGIENFLVHGGASSIVARGDQVEGSDLGWAVGISHPTKPKQRVAGVWLKDNALATSGSGKQHFHYRGKRYGHVINPRTGYPAGQHLSTTVIMPSAADADACATAAFIMSDEEKQAIAAQPWWPSIIDLIPTDRQDEVQVRSAGDICWVDESGQLPSAGCHSAPKQP